MEYSYVLTFSSGQKIFRFFPDRLPVVALQDRCVTQSSDVSVYLIIRVTKQTYKLREVSPVHGHRFLTKQTVLTCVLNRF